MEKDSFYLFIENKIFRQPWFENTSSPKELVKRTKEELERLIDSPHREKLRKKTLSGFYVLVCLE